MSNKQFTTQKQFYPVRCEVCHQNDLFDPINNKCKRCDEVKNEKIKELLSDNIDEKLQYKVLYFCRLFTAQLLFIIGQQLLKAVFLFFKIKSYNFIYEVMILLPILLLSKLIGEKVGLLILNKSNRIIYFIRKISFLVPFFNILGFMFGYYFGKLFNNIFYEIIYAIIGITCGIALQILFPKFAINFDNSFKLPKSK